MLNRWVGIACFAAMLAANLALFTHDILPAWFAGEAPKGEILSMQPGDKPRRQYGIFDKTGARIGSSWSLSNLLGGELIDLRTRTALESIPLGPNLVTPQAVINSSLVYRRSGILDHFRMTVHGFPLEVRLEGELQASGEFPCQWVIGPHSGSFILSERATKSFGDMIRPFDTLPNLFVGKTWRVDLFNPLTQMMPGVGSSGFSAQSMLVRVEAEEPLQHRGQTVTAFRVESEGLRAWVAADGRVLRQEVQMPLFETLTLVEEPFDEEAHRRSSFFFDE